MLRDQPLHGVAVYNPDLLSKHELIRLFVAREPLLERLLGDIRREVDGAVQHHLLIGRRGMGKTTLLRRLAHAIDDDPTLAAIWLPLTFPEEQYNVGHLSDFWLNCLDALGDRLERRGQTEHLGGLDADIARITDLTPEKVRQEAALAHLEAMARRLDRRFVLLVDNVDLILDRIKDDEWALRSALSTAPWLLLIGASSVGVESTYRYEAAFYDFFRVHALKGLDEPETFGLLRRLAETFNAPHVARLLDAEPARIRTLRLLAGGNPRTLVLLFSLLSQGIEGNVRTDLERLLDHCTPLYKARFESMAPQQQQVVDAMAVHWHPITAGDLAARLRMDVNAVSSQLNRLVRDGVVEKVAMHESRRAGFQVAERFFNIWYLMRASRRVRRHLLWLVEFLRLMYSPSTLAAMAAKHLEDEPGGDSEDKLHHAEYALALAAVVEDIGLRHALESQGLRLITWDKRLRPQLGEMLDLDGDDAPLKDRAERMRLLSEVKEMCFNCERLPNDYDATTLWRLVGESLAMDSSVKHAVARRIVNSDNASKLSELLLELERLRLRDEILLGSHCTLLRIGVQSGEFDSIRDYNGLLAFAHGKCMPIRAVAYVSAIESGVTWSQDVPSVDEIMSIPFTLAWNVHSLGAQSRWREMEASALKLCEVASQLPDAWLLLSEALRQQERVTEALEAARRASQMHAHSFHSWHRLGRDFIDLNAPPDAEMALRESLKMRSDSYESWLYLSLSLLVQGKRERARSAASQVIALAPPDDQAAARAWTIVILVEVGQKKWGDAWASLNTLLDWSHRDELSEQWIFLAVVMIIHLAMRDDQAPAALAIFDRTDLADRWRPLREALAAIVAGTRAVLTRVAPEIREPALVLIDQLKPDLPG